MHLLGHFREFRLLNLLDFTSKRKRMSVIVRDEDGHILLMCKGADRFGSFHPFSLLIYYYIISERTLVCTFFLDERSTLVCIQNYEITLHALEIKIMFELGFEPMTSHMKKTCYPFGRMPSHVLNVF